MNMKLSPSSSPPLSPIIFSPPLRLQCNVIIITCVTQLEVEIQDFEKSLRDRHEQVMVSRLKNLEDCARERQATIRTQRRSEYDAEVSEALTKCRHELESENKRQLQELHDGYDERKRVEVAQARTRLSDEHQRYLQV